MSAHKSKLRTALEYGIAGGLFILLLAWMAGVFHDKVGADAPVPAPPPVTGARLTVTAETLAATSELAGTVEPYQQADLMAKVSGTVQVLNVREGARVSAGQVLAVIESPELQAQVLQASGGVQASAARIAQAQRDLARYENLYREGVISQQELERVRTEFALSRASETSAAGAVNAAQAFADYRYVRAPFSGLVARRHVDPGALVGPGQPILTIHDPSRWRFVVALRARELGTLAIGDTLTVMLDETGETLAGKVAEITPAFDAASRSATVKLDLPSRPNLRAGLFGRVRYAAGDRQVLALPADAVRRAGTLAFVRVAVRVGDGETAETRYVRLGATLPDGRCEVLSGVQPGDIVLTGAEAR